MLVLLHCLSGGVFLGTFLLHLLPEAVMVTHKILPQDITYPVAETIAAVGMFLLLLLEKVSTTHQILPQVTSITNQVSHRLVKPIRSSHRSIRPSYRSA